MNHKFIAIIILILLLPFIAIGQLNGAIVVDSITRKPLPRGSIFDKGKKIVGICSDDGRIPDIPSTAYPITIRFMGYTPKLISNQATDTIFMTKYVSELPEVLVESKKRNVLHLIGYVREFSDLTTFSDTISLFREKIVDFMLPSPNVKRFRGWTAPRLLKCDSYYHITNSAGIDSVSDYFPEHFSWSDWIGIFNRTELPEKLKATTIGTDTVKGKYGAASIWQRSGETTQLDIDVLADTLNFKWIPDLAGFIRDNTDFRRLTIRYNLEDVYNDVILADNISSMSFRIESKGRRRNLKHLLHTDGGVYVETYTEIYFIDKRYITVSEARNLERHPSFENKQQYLSSAKIPELQPKVKSIIDRVKNIDRDKLRLEKKPDLRYIGKYHSRKKRKKNIFSF